MRSLKLFVPYVCIKTFFVFDELNYFLVVFSGVAVGAVMRAPLWEQYNLVTVKGLLLQLIA